MWLRSSTLISVQFGLDVTKLGEMGVLVAVGLACRLRAGVLEQAGAAVGRQRPASHNQPRLGMLLAAPAARVCWCVGGTSDQLVGMGGGHHGVTVAKEFPW
jgi:hypothetical protein